MLAKHRFISTYKALIGLLFMIFVQLEVGATVPDSVLVKFENIPSFDKKMEAYLTQSKYYNKIDLILSTKIIKLALKEDGINDHPTWKLKLTVELARRRMRLGQSTHAEFTYQAAEKVAIDAKNYEQLCKIYIGQGEAAQLAFNFDILEKNLLKAEKIAKQHKVKTLDVQLDNLRGKFYATSGEGEKAKDYFKRNLGRTDGDLKDQMSVLGNLALVSLMQNELDSALMYHLRGLRFAEEYHWLEYEASFRVRLAQNYFSLGNNSEAIDQGEKSLAIYTKLNGTLGQASSLARIASAYNAMGDYKKEGEYVSNCFNLMQQWNKQMLAYSISDLESAYLAKDEELADESSAHQETDNQLSSSRTLSWIIGLVAVLALCFFALIFLKYLRKNKSLRLEKIESNKQIHQKQLELQMRKKQISKVYGETKEISAMVHLLVSDNPNSQFIKEIQLNLKTVRSTLMRQSNWNKFKEDFNLSYPTFEKTLITKYSGLSQNDIQICIYSRAGLTQNEISEFKDISYEGVKSSFKRVKKKINVPADMKLYDFLTGI